MCYYIKMNCLVCNQVDEHMNICPECIDLLNEKLKTVEKFLMIEYINEITDLTIMFCKLDKTKNLNCCSMCKDKRFTNIKECCLECRLNIYKRAVLLFNKQEDMNEIIEKASRCYEALKLKKV
jgi:hypothetical protein